MNQNPDNTLSFDPSNFKDDKPEAADITVSGHEFRLVPKLDSYDTLVLRDLAIENFIHEDDRERFLDLWEEEDWPMNMMVEMGEQLGKAFQVKRSRTNRAQRRRNR